MTRTKAPGARTVPHVRGKPVTWLTPLPPNRGPTEADERLAVTLQKEEQRLPLKRGTKPAVRQNIARRGREPTTNPIRAVSRCNGHYRSIVGYSTDRRIRGPNLFTTVQTTLHSREGPTAGQYFAMPRCRGDTRAGDIERKVFTCGSRYSGRGADAAG